MEVRNWFAVNGDETLALDWDLNEKSHVWEIGGFEGRWAQQIWDKFHCNITIFEPQEWAFNKLVERFGGNRKVDVLPYGLWIETGEFPIGDFFTDGASLLKKKEPVVDTCQFINIDAVMSSVSPDKLVDVALMNIEGAEYTLIPRLCETGDIEKFKNFWCQFHPGLISDDPDVQFDLANEIFKKMNDTHDLLWNCYPTAVAWRLCE